MMNSGMNRRIPRQRPINPNRNTNRQKYDKSVPNDGVFANPRFTHSITCLIGTVVQVQVKNGNIYEGIFRVFSPKMEIVLECSHRVDVDNTLTNTPSRDQLIEKLVFKLNDIIQMEAKNVELDYAQKDSFTDTAISNKMNVNGERSEMKELQPWDGEADDHTGHDLDSSTANGWDPNDMFKTNKEKFNVDSTYDSSLTQYTTPIERRDDEEFKRREAVATKLANEIERSDVYKKRIDLENGDEEELYSAVHRPAVNSNKPTSPVENLPDGSVVQGRYVPPHKRPSSRGIRSGNASPVSSHSSPQQVTNQQSVNIAAEDTPPRVNGDIKTENSGLDTRLSKEPLRSSIQETNQQDGGSSGNSTSIVTKTDAKQKEVMDSLKEFSSSFNLVEKKKPATSDVKKEESKSNEAVPPSSEESVQDDDEPKRSSLNPNAPVFNPLAKPFQPKTTPTPPRPPSQPSPILPVYAMHPQYNYIIQQQPMQPAGMPQKPTRMPKQITGLPIPRPEFNGQNAVAMATGQPLLAQPQTQSYSMPFMPIYTTPQSPQAYQQVLQMQGGQRMMAPQQVAMIATSQSNGEHSNGQQPVFVPQPIPAHLATHGMHPPQPAHMQAHQQRPNHTQAAQINAAGHQNASPAHQGAGHPTSSNTPQPQIVYQNPMGSMNPQMSQQTQGAPPLQPSPHTPASPQTVHPASVSFPNFVGYHQAMPQYQWPQQYSMAQTNVTQQQHGVTPTTHSHQQPFVVVPPQGMSGSQFQQAPPQIGPGGQLTAPHVQAGNMPGQTMIPHQGTPQGHPQQMQYYVQHHGGFQQHQ